MNPLSLNQAAKEAHKSKAAILEAIRSGRLSAAKDDKNQWAIDPSELFRVYPQTQPETSNENRSQPVLENQSTTDLLAQILANEKTERDRERKQLQAQIDDLKTDRDQWRQQATNLLTHQPEPAMELAKTDQPQVPEPDQRKTAPVESKLLKKLFGDRSH